MPLKSAKGLCPGSQEEEDTPVEEDAPVGERRVEGKDKEDSGVSGSVSATQSSVRFLVTVP